MTSYKNIMIYLKKMKFSVTKPPRVFFYFKEKYEVSKFSKSMKNRKSEILKVNTTMIRVFPSIVDCVRRLHIVEIMFWKNKSNHIYFSIFTSNIQKSHILTRFSLNFMNFRYFDIFPFFECLKKTNLGSFITEISNSYKIYY